MRRDPLARLACSLVAVVSLVLAFQLWTHPSLELPRANAQGASGPGIRLRAFLFNAAAPGTSTAIITKDPLGKTITTGLAPGEGVGAFRITIQVATTTVVDLTATDGTTQKVIHLNGGTALTAGCLYTFAWGACNRIPQQDQNATPAVLLWNVQVETNSAIDLLELDEVSVGAL